MGKYSFLLHVSELPLLPEGVSVPEVGGVYAWRGAEAATRDEALEIAIDSLLQDPLLLEEVAEDLLAAAPVDVEEFKVLEHDEDLAEAESGLIFYIDDEE